MGFQESARTTFKSSRGVLKSEGPEIRRDSIRILKRL